MAIDSLAQVRHAALIRMQARPALVDIVPAARIYPQAAPAAPLWPFVKWGAFTSLPRRASCLDGAEIVGAVHGFARARKVSGAIVETGEDVASRLGTAIAQALDGFEATLDRGKARFAWSGSQLLLDSNEADDFHVIVNLRIRCLTA